ncbi:MAG: SpoVR family protein, partial [Hyphomicrobiaceae bacterium]
MTSASSPPRRDGLIGGPFVGGAADLPRRTGDVKPLFEGPEWDFKLINRCYDTMHGIAVGEMGLSIYPNQIEVITAEQMLDAYSSIGMPLMYRHWSFGKRFAYDDQMYRKGQRSLAFEIVINSNPCINYIMEENTMTMQALVIAHAAFGHNHFFKNNYQFQQWTQADHILDYLAFAKSYVSECEDRYGQEAVEYILDAAHALMSQGISRQLVARPRNPAQRDAEKAMARLEHEERTHNVIYRTLPEINLGVPPDKANRDASSPSNNPGEQRRLGLPEENILYFLEKNAPKLTDWQRELLRIVRNLSQYFYPQRQTKMMNEGCATFVHYEILNRMYERGLLTDGSMLEFLHSHSSVVFQPAFNDRRYSGLNPYALGFAMMRDIQRIATTPTEEDRAWFPEYAGNGDAMATLRDAWANYRDESFILQFLSPKVMRDFRMFSLKDDSKNPAVEV